MTDRKSFDRTIVLVNDAAAANLWAVLKANWRQMAEARTPLAVHITEAKARRSKEQLARYWAFTMHYIVEYGWLEGRQWPGLVWHEHFKEKFIGVVEGPGGRIYPMSSTELSVEAFGEFMTRVEAYATSELGVEYPS